MISGTSLNLQEIIYFPHVRLILSEPKISISFNIWVALLVFSFLGFRYLTLHML